MRALAPRLFERRFAELMDIGRARLRSLAPDWTDHNAHDPGITLMELLAWVSEAQLYSLSRLRRDERAAYAAMLGLVPTGTTAARGLLWAAPASPAATYNKRIVLDEDAVINLMEVDEPTFRPACKILWAPGRIRALAARDGGGRSVDLTAVNAQGGASFLAFGENADPRGVLALTFTCRDDAGLFGTNRDVCKGARWAIGVRAAPSPAPAESADAASRSSLNATYVDDGQRVPLKIVSDSTSGLLSTGELLVDLDEVPRTLKEFTIELRARRGLPRPPRLLRIEPNVIPIRQGRRIQSELHDDVTGFPDWALTLVVPGLRYAVGEEPLEVRVAEPGGVSDWRRTSDLASTGPDERVYELDAAAGRVTFGNGVNGKVPPAGSQVLVNYSVSNGVEGNVARNRRWHVAGFEGVFGINLDPVIGGAASTGWLQHRREARRRARAEHALVSTADIEQAALALPLLEVARAWVVPPDEHTPRTGLVTLVALRARAGGVEPSGVPETRRWLETIRRRLAPRIPLATRLAVVAPRYAAFTIRATIESEAGQHPVTVQKRIEPALRRRVALVSTGAGAPVRAPGVPVTERDLRAWLRAIEGVKRVVALDLIDVAGRRVPAIAPSRAGLPRWIASPDQISVKRPGTGGVA